MISKYLPNTLSCHYWALFISRAYYNWCPQYVGDLTFPSSFLFLHTGMCGDCSWTWAQSLRFCQLSHLQLSLLAVGFQQRFCRETKAPMVLCVQPSLTLVHITQNKKSFSEPFRVTPRPEVPHRSSGL